jgi:hypothetical protein
MISIYWQTTTILLFFYFIYAVIYMKATALFLSGSLFFLSSVSSLSALSMYSNHNALLAFLFPFHFVGYKSLYYLRF